MNNSLDVRFEEYCNNCPALSPIVDTLYSDGEVLLHIVTCSNHDVCSNIKEYLERKMGEKKDA